MTGPRFKGNYVLVLWLAIGWLGFFVFPWYALEDGFFNFEWLDLSYYFNQELAPAFILGFFDEKTWLAPLLLFLILPLFVINRPKSDPIFSTVLILSSLGGLLWIAAQGFTIGLQGWNFSLMETWLGKLGTRQFGMGYGGSLVAVSFLFILAIGVAAKGAVNGDVFVVSMIVLVVALLAIFILLPILKLFLTAFITEENTYSLKIFFEKVFSSRIWSLNCFQGGTKCGVAWNSLFMAVVVGFISTFLGLAFALVVSRTNTKLKGLLRSLAVLPLITPPFVIGLAIILLFGLSGTVTVAISQILGIEPTRWVYGLPGIVIAQSLSFTPIAFLVLIGVVENVGADLEEASQMLRASRWETFRYVTFPLIGPGIANAFLLGFIESMADFGNPFVLGGNFEVLSTEIFYAIVGAQYDQGAAAVLSIILLSFTLLTFYLQRFWLSKKSFVTLTGKGNNSKHAALPKPFSFGVMTVSLAWFSFTLIIYGMIIYGSFVKSWGFDNTLTFKHYLTTFELGFDGFDIKWKGSAWNSYWTTFMVASISAPITAFIGIIVSWLLSRKTFYFKNTFEFCTMLSFAIPGTIIGVSYLLAFNVPPIEITGTGVILILSFVFRNMPVGVRSGIASLSQIDKSLDESSLTLGANSFQTFRAVILPLIKSAILAALVFSFIRSMTSISAVIFLVSAEYDLATTYIVGRVENNDYGIAIAYSSVMIVTMLTVVVLMQKMVGKSNFKN